MKIDKRKFRASNSKSNSNDGKEDEIPLSALFRIRRPDKSHVAPGNLTVSARDDWDLPLSAICRMNMQKGLTIGSERFEVSGNIADVGRGTGGNNSRFRFYEASVAEELDEVMVNKEYFSAFEGDGRINGGVESGRRDKDDEIPLSALLSIRRRKKSCVTPGNSTVTARSLGCENVWKHPLSALRRMNMREGLGLDVLEVSGNIMDAGVGISREKSGERSFKNFVPGDGNKRGFQFSDVSVPGEWDEVMLNKGDFSSFEVNVRISSSDESSSECNGAIQSLPFGYKDPNGKQLWGLKEHNEPREDESASRFQVKKNGIGTAEDSCPVNDFSIDEESCSYEEDNGFRVQRFKVGDLVWAKAFGNKWWPGWIYRRAGYQVGVSFFGCKRSGLFKVSEVCGFEEEYLASSKMAGGKLLDAIDCALEDLCHRGALELSCPCLGWSEDMERVILSNVGDQTKNFVQAKEGFEPFELLSIVLKMAVCAQCQSDEAVRAAKVRGQVLAFRRYVSIRLDWMYYETMRISGSCSVSEDAEGTVLEMDSHASPENKIMHTYIQEAEEDIQVNNEKDELDVFSQQIRENSHSCLTSKMDFSLFYSDEEFGSLQDQLSDADDERLSVEEDSGTKDLVEQNSTAHVLQLGKEGLSACHLRAAHDNADIRTEFHLNSGSLPLDYDSYAHKGTLNLCRKDSVCHSPADADDGSLSKTVLEHERELNQHDMFAAARESKLDNDSMKHEFSLCKEQNDVTAAVWAHESGTFIRPENELQLPSPISREPLLASKTHIYAGHADKGQSLQETLKYIYCLSLDPFYTGSGHLKFVCDNVLRFRRLVYKNIPSLVSLKHILDYDYKPKMHSICSLDPLSCPTKNTIKAEPIYEVGFVNDMAGKNQLLLHSSDYKTGMDQFNMVGAAANLNDDSSNAKAIVNDLNCLVKSSEDGSIGKRRLDVTAASDLPFKLQKTQPLPSMHGSGDDSPLKEPKSLEPKDRDDSDLSYKGRMQSHQGMLRHLHCLALDPFYSGKENLKSIKQMFLKYRALVSVNVSNLVSSKCTSVGNHALRIRDVPDLSGSQSLPCHQDCTSDTKSRSNAEICFVNGGNNEAELFADVGVDIHSGEKVGTDMHGVEQDTKQVKFSTNYTLDRFSGSVLGKRSVDEPFVSDPLKLLKSGSYSSASVSDSCMSSSRSKIDSQNISDLASVEHISSGSHALEATNMQQKMSTLRLGSQFSDSVDKVHSDHKACLENDAVTKIQLASHVNDDGKMLCDESDHLAKVSAESDKRGVICKSDVMQKCLDISINAMSASPFAKVDVETKATKITQLSYQISDNGQKISTGVSCSGCHRENISHVVRRRRHDPLVDSRPSFNSQLSLLYASSLVKDGLNGFNTTIDDKTTSKMRKSPNKHVLLHMKFPKDFTLPVKDELVKKFSVFGPLDVSRTRVFFYTGSAQVTFLHQHDAEAAYWHARKNNLFGKANVRFWLSQHTGTQASSLPSTVQPTSTCKSCLKTSNADEGQLVLEKNPDNPLLLMTLQKKKSVTFSGLSGFCNCSDEEKPDISLQMLLLLEKCDQMVCNIRDCLGLGSYYSIFMNYSYDPDHIS